MRIAGLIRAWRKDARLSIREAADRIGVDRGALYRLEKGESVNQATVLQLLHWAFGEKDSLSNLEEAA
jgi:transcriptional regulator with XRE-family HTH domain